MYKAAPGKIERWRIDGTLTTKTPLHLGSGETRKFDENERAISKEMKDAGALDAEYAAVFTGAEGRPILPATSLKGALRAWAEAAGYDAGAIERLFGSKEKGSPLRFHDATLADGTPAEPKDPNVRYWSEKRRTCVSAQVSLDPATGAAAEHLLYHVEYVPAGARFRWTIDAQNLSAGDRDQLLDALNGAFADPLRPARLGAGGADGWGRVEWTLDKVRKFDAAEFLAADPPKSWTKCLHALTGAQLEQWKTASAGGRQAGRARVVTLKLTLTFDGPVLVNDPTRRKRAPSKERANEAVGHAAIRNEQGDYYLPASSVRGAFRAQARRIWQTLAWGGSQDLSTAQMEIPRKDKLGGLAPFLQAFGATGWRSPIEFGDFRLQGSPCEPTQEFVAIDRFTGGAADAKKFKAQGLWNPVFVGEIRIRADRWGHKDVNADAWAWLLVAYTLRDWQEGDGAIGFGRTKGYGRFTAEIEVDDAAAALAGVLCQDAVTLASERVRGWDAALKAAVGLLREDKSQ